MKKILLIFLSTITLSQVNGQQMPFFSQYTLNHYAINPAATGTSRDLPLAFSYRKQWASFPESPSVQYLSGNMEVYQAMGAGAKILNYTAGPLRKTGLELTYSYHLVMNQDMNLSFGLSGLLYQFHLGKNELTVEDNNDMLFTGKEGMIVVDAIFGTYLYGEKYFAGLSVPQLFNRNVDLKTDNIIQEKQVRHYYIHGGYTFDINPDISFQPSLLFKIMGSGLYQVDINAMAEYREMVSFGLSVRTSDAIGIQVGYHYKEFRFGYAYDITFSDVKVASAGSHELIFIYTLPNFLNHP